MIPILYERDEIDFVSNGLGRLRDCISCVVTEERNGVFEIEFQYPVDGHRFDQIVEGRIIAAEHDNSGDIQPFDIVGHTKPMNGIVTFRGVHISYRQNKIVAAGTNINSISDAFAMLSAGLPSNPFNYSTDIISSAYMAAADGVPRTVRTLLGGIDGSILDTYGGEFKFDKFSVQLLKARGVERDFTIRYGVNLIDYNEETDYSESFKSVVAYWLGTDDQGKPDVVKTGVISGDAETVTGRDETIALDLTDRFEEKPTVAQVETAAQSYLQSSTPWLPAQTIEVDFISLRDTLEYEEFAPLFDCGLCDTVRVVFPRYGMKGSYKIVKTEYDVLAERFSLLELGTLSVSLSEALGISSGLDTSKGGSSSKPVPIKSGNANIGQISANSYKDFSVAFGEPFDKQPNVSATLFSSGKAVNIGNVCVSVFGVSSTGFTIRIFNNRSSTINPTVEWIAVAP